MSGQTHPFLTAWRDYQPQAPYHLPTDKLLLSHSKHVTRFEEWQSYISDHDFGKRDKGQLHLDLLPMPFVGDLQKAVVFLLMLNPGLTPSDYFGEYQVTDYRSALLRNLKQNEDPSFLFLDPAYSWHGGYLYWQAKLGNLILELSQRQGCSFGDARRQMQGRVATIELLPYHSSFYNVPPRLLNTLGSVSLAKSYVLEELVPRAVDGECLIVASRAKRQWGLPDHKNIVAYTGTEARAAHLSAKTRGGDAILSFLENRRDRD